MPQFIAQYIDGKIRTNNPAMFESVLRGFKDHFLIIIEPYRKTRSGQQNRYYWGVVIERLSNHTGFTKDEMHEVLKYKFLSFEKESRDGQKFIVTRSTVSLDTKEMEDYLESVRRWAAQDLNCDIPEPNE